MGIGNLCEKKLAVVLVYTWVSGIVGLLLLAASMSITLHDRFVSQN